MNGIEDKSLKVWDGRVTARVKIAGDGPPVVFFHNAFGLQWDPFLARLAERYTVYAPEHPGTSEGDPDAVRALDNMWDLVLFYDELMEALKLNSVPLIGHSYGGMIALELAANSPSRASRVVAVSALGLWRDDTPIPNYHITKLEELIPMVVVDPSGPLAQTISAMPEDPEEGVQLAVKRLWTLACTGRFVWPIPDKGLKKRLHRVNTPTLIIWGEKDRLIPPVYGEEFKSRIRGARLEVLDEASHLVHLEQTDRVLRLIDEFIAS